MPVSTWMARSVIDALPKTYHQPRRPAAPLGMGWVNIGSRLSRKPTRTSSQFPNDRSQRLIIGKEPMMRRWLRSLGNWLDVRVGFRESLLPMLTHPIPRGAAGRLGWWYVFGSASITLLAIQVLTGIGLALVYVPTADEAYNSLLYLDYEQPYGWLL